MPTEIAAPNSTAAVEGTPEKDPGAPTKIMIIEDDKVLRDVITAILKREGHGVVSFPDGREAIEAFTAEPCDLVFTDLGLPEMSGWEVALAVKEQSPSTPVVLVTGYGNQLEVSETREKGVDLILPKPFEFADVRKTVAEALALKRSGEDGG